MVPLRPLPDESTSTVDPLGSFMSHSAIVLVAAAPTTPVANVTSAVAVSAITATFALPMVPPLVLLRP